MDTATDAAIKPKNGAKRAIAKENKREMLTLWLCMGLVYYGLEGVFHLFVNGGWANVTMLAVGGLCCVLVGGLNQLHAFRRINVLFQSIMGAAIVTGVEFVSGLILNVLLGMKIWDYSNLPLNVMGQVCLLFSVIWLGLMPFAIWLEDMFRLKLWGEGKRYTVKEIYLEFVGVKRTRE